MSRVMPLTWSPDAGGVPEDQRAVSGRRPREALLGLSGIFADDLPQNADFVAQ